MQTSIRVTQETRDAVARIATDELGGVSMEEAMRTVLFEHDSRVALARLAADPDAVGAYLRENEELAEVEVPVVE